MRRGEAEQIKRAVVLISSDGGYDEDMAILCKLVGLVYPIWELKDVRIVTTQELAARPNSEFADHMVQRRWFDYLAGRKARAALAAVGYEAPVGEKEAER